MHDLEPAQQLAVLARALSRRGYMDVTGRLTMRLGGGHYLVVPAGVRWAEVTAGAVVTVDGAADAPPSVSAGLRAQLRLHEIRDAAVILHDHPHWTTYWAVMGELPPALDHVGARVPPMEIAADPVGVADGEAKYQRLPKECKIVLLQNHGALLLLDSITEAFFAAEALEWRSRLAWHLRGAAEPMSTREQDVVYAGFEGYAQTYRLFDAIVREQVAADSAVLT